MDIEAKSLWKRIEALNPYPTLTKLTEETGLDYRNIKNQRHLGRIPKSDDLYSLARELNCSMEYLLTGVDSKSYPDRIERIAQRLLHFATEEDYILVERILRIQRSSLLEEKNA